MEGQSSKQRLQHIPRHSSTNDVPLDVRINRTRELAAGS